MANKSKLRKKIISMLESFGLNVEFQKIPYDPEKPIWACIMGDDIMVDPRTPDNAIDLCLMHEFGHFIQEKLGMPLSEKHADNIAVTILKKKHKNFGNNSKL